MEVYQTSLATVMRSAARAHSLHRHSTSYQSPPGPPPTCHDDDVEILSDVWYSQDSITTGRPKEESTGSGPVDGVHFTPPFGPV